MSAPKGNKFWEARSSHGRKPLWEDSEQLREACYEYIQWVEENPLEEAIVYQGALNTKQAKPLMRAMTQSGLCVFLGISVETWNQYGKKQDFSEVVSEIELIMRTQKFEGAAAGQLNANIIARDLGLKESSEHDHRSTDGSMSPKPSIDPSELTDEDLAALEQILAKQSPNS